jgi:hypothetical protein
MEQKEKIKEEWKSVSGFEEYEVSNKGRVLLPSGKIRESNYNSTSVYEVITLRNGDKKKTTPIHRLVAELFIDNIFHKKYVNHKNGIKKDNSFENLEWVTSSENIKHYHNVLKSKEKRTDKLSKSLIKRLVTPSSFAKLVNQQPSRISNLIYLGALKTIMVGGQKFIENNEENINIAKRKTNDKK